MGIVHYMAQKGMTVKELAELADVEEETIEKADRDGEATLGVVLKISKALDIEPIFLG